MNKTALIIVSLGLVILLGVIFIDGPSSKNAIVGLGAVNNVEIRDGVQYINIIAKGGYTPSKTSAEAGIPTKLIVETNDTLDCSSSLVIKKAGYQEILPPTGETEIDLGTPKSGETYDGLCSMGMYNFSIEFQG